MNEFVTWEILSEYASFLVLVFMVVEFLKELKWFKPIPTKYFSACIAFILMVLFQFHSGTFAWFDIVLYILTSISISLGANGLATFNKNKKTVPEVITEEIENKEV